MKKVLSLIVVLIFLLPMVLALDETTISAGNPIQTNTPADIEQKAQMQRIEDKLNALPSVDAANQNFSTLDAAIDKKVAGATLYFIVLFIVNDVLFLGIFFYLLTKALK